MAIGALYISHPTFDFSKLNSKWLTKKNLSKAIDSLEIEDYHTSIEDSGIKIGRIEQDLLTHCQKIIFLDLSWENIINSENHMNYAQVVNLAISKFDATGAEDIVSKLKSHCAFLRDTRKTLDPVMWVAGCSWTSAYGVEDDQRWSSLVANKLDISEVNLAKGGASIWDASDQLLRSDVQKGDIVVWGLTSAGRVEAVSNSKLSSWTIKQSKEFNYYKIDYFFSNTQYLLALRQIHQVINYCNKVGATLYIVNFLDQAWIPLMTGTYEKFIDLQHTFNDKTFRYDMIDYAHDNEHPGPKQHQEYAKKISNFIQGK